MYERTLALIGEDSLNKIKRKNILVLGAGGVGGYAIEHPCKKWYSKYNDSRL